MSNETTPRCTVIVVNYNGGTLVLECLRSLRQQQAPGLDVEVVVVDNDSRDGSDALIEREHPEVRLIRTGRNGGFAAGVNRGITETSGDVVVLLNPDARAEPGFLAEITAPLLDGGRVAATTARIVLTGLFVPAGPGGTGYLAADGSRWVRVAGTPSDGVTLLNSTGLEITASGNGRDRSWLAPESEARQPRDVFGFCGGASALRRDALDDVGLLDESFFMYYEDLDLSWRFRRKGWSVVYVEGAVTLHQHAASSGVRSRLFLVNNVRNRLIVSRRHGTPAMARAALAHTLGSLVKSIVRGVRPGPAGGEARARAAATAIALLHAARQLRSVRAEAAALDGRAVLERDFVNDWVVSDR